MVHWVLLFATRTTLHHLSDIFYNLTKFFESFFVPSLGDRNPDRENGQFYRDIPRSVVWEGNDEEPPQSFYSSYLLRSTPYCSNINRRTSS
jgi:hypothetical protein